jgi:hypothetical protein
MVADGIINPALSKLDCDYEAVRLIVNWPTGVNERNGDVTPTIPLKQAKSMAFIDLTVSQT